MTYMTNNLLNIRVELLNDIKSTKDASIPAKIIWQNKSSDNITVKPRKKGVFHFKKNDQEIKFGELENEHNVEFKIKANETIEQKAIVKVLKTSRKHLNKVNSIELKLSLPYSIRIEKSEESVVVRVNRILKRTKS